MNFKEQAVELEKTIRSSEEYVTLKKAYEAVNADPQAKQMFDSFRNLQLQLQQKQASGQPITQEEAGQAQQQLQLLQQQPLISQLMASEQRMSQVIEEINQTLTKPLMELYQG